MPSHCRAVGSFQIKQQPYRALSAQSSILMINGCKSFFRDLNRNLRIAITVLINNIIISRKFLSIVSNIVILWHLMNVDRRDYRQECSISRWFCSLTRDGRARSRTFTWIPFAIGQASGCPKNRLLKSRWLLFSMRPGNLISYSATAAPFLSLFFFVAYSFSGA